MSQAANQWEVQDIHRTTGELTKDIPYLTLLGQLWSVLCEYFEEELLSWLIEAEWHIYASPNYTIIASDNGVWPVWHQTIIWTNAGLLLIKTLGTNFSENLMKIEQFPLN